MKPAAILSLLCLMAALLGTSRASAQNCVRVRVQIQQELTFERVAFDAELTLGNNLPDVPLENLQAALVITDENDNPVDDLFFIAAPDIQGVTGGIEGGGSIAAGDSATISWLIIPTVGAGGTDPAGTEYLVGVNLVLGPAGQPAVEIPVVPDSISVRPQPLLNLKYVLPRFVEGDDPLTPEVIEPSVPFTVGLRVNNTGYGAANALRLSSGQPKIVENENGLLIAFKLLGSQVNAEPETPSLLADIGNLSSMSAAIVRWRMTASLEGEFVEFNASYEHADELGGEKTSLIDEVCTATLIQTILVNTPGSDDIPDFLADSDGGEDPLPDVIYSSDGQDFSVTVAEDGNVSNPVDAGTPSTTLTFTPETGWRYVRVDDPSSGDMALSTVIRSDGQPIPAEHAWLEDLPVPGEKGVRLPYLSLLDKDSTGEYTVNFRIPTTLDDPGDQAVLAESLLEFTLTSTMAGGLTPAYFMKFEDGVPPGPAPALDPSTGEFTWTPNESQIAAHTVTFTVTDDGDPSFSDSKTVTISVDDPNLVVDAGADKAALPGSRVTLDATGSGGPSPLTYEWNQTAGPPVALFAPNGPTPYFTAPDVTGNTVITWELTLTDSMERSDTDSVNVTIAVDGPIADAGDDQSVEGSNNVLLDGTASVGMAITHSWVQVSGPVVTLADADTATPSFAAPVDSVARTIMLRLTVEDLVGLTDTDLVTIDVTPSPLSGDLWMFE